MRYRTLPFYLDDKTIQDLHQLMKLSIEDEDGITIYRIYEGNTNQGWYRQIIRAGVRKLREDFEKKKKELESI